MLYESDSDDFGGFKRLDGAHGKWFETEERMTDKRPYTLRLYIPTQTCMVLCPYENVTRYVNKISEPEYVRRAHCKMPAITDRQRS